jgi:transposase
LLQVLSKAGRAAHRADARKVKSFIRSFGTLGKTDAIDARALAAYGRERHAKLARQTPDPQRERLQALVLKRRDLIADRQAYKNRLAAPGAAAVQRQLGKLLASFDQQIADISREMHRWPAWHRTRTRAAPQMHIAAPEAGGRRSNGCCSWRRWSRQNMTRSNAVL